MSNITYNFTNQNFVVTGASSGMGKQVVVELAEAGASVLAIARGEDALRSLQKLYPEKIVIAAVDVCDSEKLKESINSFVKSKGKLDGVVHAAGISGLTPIKSYDEAEARKIVDISFFDDPIDDLIGKFFCFGIERIAEESKHGQLIECAQSLRAASDT